MYRRRRRWLPRSVAGGFLGMVLLVGVAAAREGEATRWNARFDAVHSVGEQCAALGALVEASEELPAPTMQAILAHAVASPRLHPLLAAQATQYLAHYHEQQGQADAAQALRRALGYQGDWNVLGPFAAEGRSGHERPFPPEEALATLDPDPRARFPGKEREIGWRVLPPAAFVDGAVFLDAVLRPDQDAVAYLVGYVQSEQAQAVALRVGSPGPVKVWVGDRLVLSRDVLRPAQPDQDAAGVVLRPGVERIVIKTLVTQGAWRFYFRFTTPGGGPLPGVVVHATKPPGHGAGAASASTGRGVAVVDLGRDLKRRAESRKTAAQAWLDFAWCSFLLAPEDRETKPVESALRRALALPGAKAGSALRRGVLGLLGQVAAEADDRRSALRELLAQATEAKEKAKLLHALGGLWFRQDREAQAIATWREAEALDPGNVPVQLALANEERRAGQALVALRRIDALPAEAQARPAALKARADLLFGLGRVDEAARAYERLQREQRRDIPATRDLVLIHRLRGEAEQGAALLRALAQAHPERLSLVFEEVALREGLGQVDQAVARLRALGERLPDEASVWEALGRLEARADRLPAAVASFRRSLALRPQNPTLRRYEEHLAGTVAPASRRGDDLAKTYALAAEPLAKARFAQPVRDGEAPLEVLLDRTVVRVHPNGLADRFVQRIVQIDTERAAKDNQQSFIHFEPGRQEVEVRVARVLRDVDGQVAISQSTTRDEQNLSEPWYGLYYDTRAVVVGFENLKPGDLVELQYTVSDLGYTNELSDYFGDFQVISDGVPLHRWDYTLLVPRDRPIYMNPLDPRRVKREEEVRGDTRLYRFTALNVPRVISEPAMPGFAEVASYLHVSTYKSWADVGAWYWRLVADQLTDDGSLKRAALAATAGQRTVLGKVKALHRLVVEGTRYVGLEFGIHGYKPYRSTQVLLRKFGDCKDKASLLMSLLRAVGVEAELVLLRTRRGGDIDPSPASLAVFDHAIAYVPQLDLFIDGTAEFSGLDELPAGDQDVMALRVSPHGARLIRTPAFPATANRADRRWQITLAADGAATIEEHFTIAGQSAHEWRERYQSPSERPSLYGKVWSGRYAGARLARVRMDVDDRNRPAQVDARVSVPQLGEPLGVGRWRLPTSSREADFTKTYARLSDRQYPLLLGFPWLHREMLEYRLPPGYRLFSAPSDRVVTSPFGHFDLRVTKSRDGRRIAVESTLRVDQRRIAPGDYPAFRAFLGDTDAILSEKLVVGKAGTP